MNMGFWLKWSWRDLRARWVQVLAIGIIISLGTGIFAGSGGQQTWRENSYDLSYGNLNMYDLQVRFATGSFLNQDEVTEALADIEGIEHLETRLIQPTFVDASHDEETIVVRGEIIGVDVADGGPHVNGIFVDNESGRTLTDADSGENAVVVEYKFAAAYGLEPGSPLRISGDIALDFVGAGHSPEYFMIMPETGTFFGESNFAALFTSLATLQQLTEHEDMINNVVVSIEEGADRDAIYAEIESRMATTFPNIGIEILVTEDDAIYTMLYQDAAGDQETMDSIAMLFLIGAALGAFNLAGRLVEAQRREIGIGMALGVPRHWIAFRPMLVGMQIAILGTILGFIVGLGLSQLYGYVLEEIVPLPFYELTFYLPGYIQATLFGITLPFIATLIPVWRAVRVQPVDAIKSGYLVAKGGGWSRLANYLPLPGRSFTQMPIKNILRSPWRTLLTVFGIAIAIMLMTAVVGFMDSFAVTMQATDDAYRYQGGNRLLVTMNTLYPRDNRVVESLINLENEAGTAVFERNEQALMLGGKLISADGDEIETLIELHDMQDSAIWVPELIAGDYISDQPGIIISEKSADDFGLGVGDTVILEHPRREGLFSFQFVESELRVNGIHNNPLRPLTYIDRQHGDLMGLANATNLIVLEPAKGIEVDEIKALLLTQNGVASVQAITEYSEAVEIMLEFITAALYIMQGVVVILAFLIAFNATSISVDERVREIATMFAYGLPLRTVTRMQMIENFIIGLLGTAIGIGLGWLVIQTILFARVVEQVPDFKFIIKIAPETFMMAGALGIIVVTLTPLLSIRRMRNMDLPSTLRVME